MMGFYQGQKAGIVVALSQAAARNEPALATTDDEARDVASMFRASIAKKNAQVEDFVAGATCRTL
jgi:hypothetical protein